MVSTGGTGIARHLERGMRGEVAAVSFLLDHQYKIMERNWRAKAGEIDIICSKDNLVIFAEVKTRSINSRTLPGEALTKKKQARLVRTASLYLSDKRLWHLQTRFDLLSVFARQNSFQVEHYTNVIEISHTMGSCHASWQPW